MLQCMCYDGDNKDYFSKEHVAGNIELIAKAYEAIASLVTADARLAKQLHRMLVLDVVVFRGQQKLESILVNDDADLWRILGLHTSEHRRRVIGQHKLRFFARVHRQASRPSF
eukprot:TRINITY_DN23856_c0_g1_i1.p2 TRINITY_DN23856_c0_g1~~TRINITY_DN23856_c0_g1_i1.p2  ORF type:complete len:113 (-),score=38.76 TRINITY_DN23856_c0_g1_i1:26-364(-)